MLRLVHREEETSIVVWQTTYLVTLLVALIHPHKPPLSCLYQANLFSRTTTTEKPAFLIICQQKNDDISRSHFIVSSC